MLTSAGEGGVPIATRCVRSLYEVRQGFPILKYVLTLKLFFSFSMISSGTATLGFTSSCGKLRSRKLGRSNFQSLWYVVR